MNFKHSAEHIGLIFSMKIGIQLLGNSPRFKSRDRGGESYERNKPTENSAKKFLGSTISQYASRHRLVHQRQLKGGRQKHATILS